MRTAACHSPAMASESSKALARADFMMLSDVRESGVVMGIRTEDELVLAAVVRVRNILVHKK